MITKCHIRDVPLAEIVKNHPGMQATDEQWELVRGKLVVIDSNEYAVLDYCGGMSWKVIGGDYLKVCAELWQNLDPAGLAVCEHMVEMD